MTEAEVRMLQTLTGSWAKECQQPLAAREKEKRKTYGQAFSLRGSKEKQLNS